MGRRIWIVALGLCVSLVGGGYLAGQESQAGSFAELLDRVMVKQEMVLIPAGEFVMGIEDDADDNLPHTVRVDAFYLDRYEVTNAQYFVYCQEAGARLPAFWGIGELHSGLDYPNHPVVGVSWGQARAYAEWAGKRLPTEAEWEYAARGGLVGKKYPNGDELGEAANHWPSEGTEPVGGYPANGFGLNDMAGNVVEWVADLYDPVYYLRSPQENPPGPEEGRFRVIRGGGWHSGPSCNRVGHRNALPSTWVDFAVGFRCARDVEDAAAAASDGDMPEPIVGGRAARGSPRRTWRAGYPISPLA